MTSVRPATSRPGAGGAPSGRRPDRDQQRRRRQAVIRRRRLTLAAAVVIAVLAGRLLLSLGHESPKAKPVVADPSLVTGTAIDPSAFSAGACRVYPPLVGDRHQTVFLDAGHGGIDPGAIGTTSDGRTIHEADETLPVELDAMALLRGQGYRVAVSRTTASSVVRLTPADMAQGALSIQGAHDDVAARDMCANEARATILIGIYFDAGASASNAGSVTAWDTVRPFAAANQRLAQAVQSNVLAVLDSHGWAIPDDGVLSDATLGGPARSASAGSYGHLLLLGPASPGYFSTPSEMPGALIEPLFITDPFEGSIADRQAGQHAIALGLDQAVQQYLAPPPAAGGSSLTSPTS